MQIDGTYSSIQLTYKYLWIALQPLARHLDSALDWSRLSSNSNMHRAIYMLSQLPLLKGQSWVLYELLPWTYIFQVVEYNVYLSVSSVSCMVPWWHHKANKNYSVPCMKPDISHSFAWTMNHLQTSCKALWMLSSNMSETHSKWWLDLTNLQILMIRSKLTSWVLKR